jgi:ATP-dependent Clp protease protease subunit
MNSPGGIASAGFVGYDLISELTNKLEIRSYVEGNCSSAATLLSIGASKRYITPSSTMLIHELSTFIGGKLSEITTEFENCKKVEAIIENIYLKHTKIKKEELEVLLRKDVLLTAEDCLEKGLVDEIKTSIF